MHGIVFNQLQKYVTARLGDDAWRSVLEAADKRGSVYLASTSYPDAELVSLVVAACKITNRPAAAVLEDFGTFLVSDLVQVYGYAIKPEWRTIDLLEHTESSIHTVVRLRDPAAQPPRLVMVRTGPKSVDLTYTSARKLCALAKGIAKGVAAHYREQLHVTETACMLTGASACTMTFAVS